MAGSDPRRGRTYQVEPPRRLVIRTDGAARNNPGPASGGAVLIDGPTARPR